jgi:signal transduction histidine kinase
VVINTGLVPEVIRDSITRVHEGAAAAGRDPSQVDLWWLPLTNLAEDRQTAVEEIKMSLAAAGNHLSRFTTEGKHIPPELLPKVGEPFFTTKSEGKGTGLGLAICRRIVEEHGGTITLTSEVGKGTTVRLEFPGMGK